MASARSVKRTWHFRQLFQSQLVLAAVAAVTFFLSFLFSWFSAVRYWSVITIRVIPGSVTSLRISLIRHAEATTGKEMSRKRSRLQEKAQATQEVNQLIERLSDGKKRLNILVSCLRLSGTYPSSALFNLLAPACSMPPSAPKEQWDSFVRINSLLEELVKKQGPSSEPQLSAATN